MSDKKKTNLPARTEKPIRAQQYEISIERASSGSTEAEAAILSAILYMSFEKAHNHVLEASGRSSIIVASGEVVQTKMKRASEALNNIEKQNPDIAPCRIIATNLNL